MSLFDHFSRIYVTHEDMRRQTCEMMKNLIEDYELDLLNGYTITRIAHIPNKTSEDEEFLEYLFSKVNPKRVSAKCIIDYMENTETDLDVEFLRKMIEKHNAYSGTRKNYSSHSSILVNAAAYRVTDENILETLFSIVDPNCVDYEDSTPLMWAASEPNLAALKVILPKCTKETIEQKGNRPTRPGYSALEYLISSNLNLRDKLPLFALKLFLKAGADYSYVKEPHKGRIGVLATIQRIDKTITKYPKIITKEAEDRFYRITLLDEHTCNVRVLGVDVDELQEGIGYTLKGDNIALNYDVVEL